MLPPLSIARRQIVYPSQEIKLFYRNLFLLNTEFMVQLSLRRSLHAHHCRFQICPCFARNAERMRAARVGPHVWKCDFLRGTLLEQESVGGVEEEDGEGAVKEAGVDVGHQMTWRDIELVTIYQER